MSRLQIPGAAGATIDAATPLTREILADTTANRPRYGDGSTAGGKPLAFLADVGGAPITDAMAAVTQSATLQAGRRTLNAGPWISIFDYITDATTRAAILAFTQTADVSTQVQAACDAADDIGAAIYFPPGRYPILSSVTTSNVSFIGDMFVEDVYPHGSKGTVFIFTSTANTPFKLGDSTSFQNIIFYWPNQVDSAATWVANSGPIAYPPLIENASTSTTLVGFQMIHCTVVNAYDFMDVGGASANDKGGRWTFTGNRICALRRTFNLNNIPDYIELTGNIFGWNHFSSEMNHFGGGSAATISVTSITRSSSTATVTTASAHGLTTGQKATIAGATQSDYNGQYVVTVTGATTFTYTVANSPATPATGTITSTAFYLRDYFTDNAVGIRVTGDATSSTISTTPVTGIFMAGGFWFGHRRVIDVDGGTLSNLDMAGVTFDAVQQIVHTRNYGVIVGSVDMGAGSFAYKYNYTTTATPAVFLIDTPAGSGVTPVAALHVTGDMGYCCGTFLSATGAYVRELNANVHISAFGHLTTDAGTYYAADINCSSARVRLSGLYEASAASSGGVNRTGIRVADSLLCSINDAMFANCDRPIDITDTAGAYEVSGCVSLVTGDTYSLNSATANIVAMGNYFDKRNYAVEPLSGTRNASAVNGLDVRGGTAGAAARLTTSGADTNIVLQLDTKGTDDFGSAIQFRPGGVLGALVRATASAVNYFAIKPGATGNNVTISAGGTDTNVGLLIGGQGTGRVLFTSNACPNATGTQTLGDTSNGWGALHLETLATINIDNGNWLATHSSGILTVGTGDLRVTNAGTNSASVVTVGGTQTLTNKTLPVTSFGSTTYTVIGIGFVVAGVNFNSANTDNAVAITLPTGFTRYRVVGVMIDGASASLTTATAGVFTATGAGGTAIVASGSAITVSTASENTNNNMMAMTTVNSNTNSFAVASTPTIYFRVQNPQGSAATASVTIQIQPLP